MKRIYEQSVAVPWSLSHYIPLNGFHPLYRALFDDGTIRPPIHAWDNVELSAMLRGDESFRTTCLQLVDECAAAYPSSPDTADMRQAYLKAFHLPNLGLTSLLPGDIELHHTAPYPSLQRPFVFHCESFAPIFFPFAHQGTGRLPEVDALRRHYGRIFESPLCLGIFSHLQETLDDIGTFFRSVAVERKLHLSAIGLSSKSVTPPVESAAIRLEHPVFLFLNSANQNPANFIHRGGHLVLRFWQEFVTRGHAGHLYLRCARPEDTVLTEHGVDVHFLAREDGRSVTWIPDYLDMRELDALIRTSTFMLIPSASLHSVSIMQSMALGAVPVVTDTIGTSLYVQDDRNGIVLDGVRETNWFTDPETGIRVDRYHRSETLDAHMTGQLYRRIQSLLDAPDRYREMRDHAIADASDRFTGSRFSDSFWGAVREIAARQPAPRQPPIPVAPGNTLVHDCLLDDADWPRVFESVTQPVRRLRTDGGTVTEVGGAFVYTAGNAGVGLHDWCVLSEHADPAAPRLRLATDIKSLGGCFLAAPGSRPLPQGLRSHPLVVELSRILAPYPRLHALGTRVLRRMRAARRNLGVPRPIRCEPNDIQLVLQDYLGFNVIRCEATWYALPPQEGAFMLERVVRGDYRLCLQAGNLKSLQRRIAEHRTKESRAREDTVLVAEGVDGMNVVRHGTEFFAIPQSEGAFCLERAESNGYSRILRGPSLDAVLGAITGEDQGDGDAR